MALEYEQIQWRDAPDTSTPVNSENLNRMDAMIAQIVNYLNTESGGIHSHVGMVIHSTTLDTMDKVIAEYGGTEWMPIRGRFLIGADEDAYPVNSSGGSADAIVPAHTHIISSAGNATQATHRHDLNASNSSYESSNGGVRIFKPAGPTGVVKWTDSSQPSEQAYSTLETYTVTTKANGNTALPAHKHTCQVTGEDATGRNLPPYLAVYTWVRTA